MCTLKPRLHRDVTMETETRRDVETKTATPLRIARFNVNVRPHWPIISVMSLPYAIMIVAYIVCVQLYICVVF